MMSLTSVGRFDKLSTTFLTLSAATELPTIRQWSTQPMQVS